MNVWINQSINKWMDIFFLITKTILHQGIIVKKQQREIMGDWIRQQSIPLDACWDLSRAHRNCIALIRFKLYKWLDRVHVLTCMYCIYMGHGVAYNCKLLKLLYLMNCHTWQYKYRFEVILLLLLRTVLLRWLAFCQVVKFASDYSEMVTLVSSLSSSSSSS
jgi:hypothetical protein